MSRLYEDQNRESLPPLKWGSPVRKWKAGHAIYRDSTLDLSDRLYRYMRARDAFLTIQSRTLWFSSVAGWDDPHERWWCSHLFRPGAHLASASAYGCCWTRRSLDEPFWRMYACECKDDDDGKPRERPAVRRLPAVRFRARASDLFTWLGDTASQQLGKAYMGNVRYVDYEKLRGAATALRARADSPSPAAATGLLMKRLAFKFEHEVRMLWIERSPVKEGQAFAIDPELLFNQVMIGPDRDPERRLEVKDRLIALGVPSERIKMSTVGDPPELRVLRSAGVDQ